MGDFNAWHGSAVFERMEAKGMSFQPLTCSTYHFNRGWNVISAIDHLATSSGIESVMTPIALSRQFEGEWPSDHYPVLGDFRLQ